MAGEDFNIRFTHLKSFMLVSYNWLGSYFKEKLPEPEKLVDVLSLHAFEIEGLEQLRALENGRVVVLQKWKVL